MSQSRRYLAEFLTALGLLIAPFVCRISGSRRTP